MSNINRLKQEWINLAPRWIKEVREGKILHAMVF